MQLSSELQIGCFLNEFLSLILIDQTNLFIRFSLIHYSILRTGKEANSLDYSRH